jgi:hypothetical protein
MDKWIKKNAPVLYSRKFWGILAYSVLEYVQAKGWIGGMEIQALTQLVFAATGVGVADSLFRKLGPVKK